MKNKGVILMRRSSVVYFGLFFLISILFITGCKSETEKEASKLSVINCTRNASADNAKVSLEYKVYYKGDYVRILNSIEKITSSSSSVLDEYEEAYKKIFSAYDGLDYYENTITRKDNSVISETTINYGKIDTDQLLEIEGEEDNVIEDGKVKVSTWISFAEKLGATCDD